MFWDFENDNEYELGNYIDPWTACGLHCGDVIGRCSCGEGIVVQEDDVTGEAFAECLYCGKQFDITGEIREEQVLYWYAENDILI